MVVKFRCNFYCSREFASVPFAGYEVKKALGRDFNSDEHYLVKLALK